MRRVLHSSRKECYPSSSPLQSLNENQTFLPCPFHPRLKGKGGTTEEEKTKRYPPGVVTDVTIGDPRSAASSMTTGSLLACCLEGERRGSEILALFDLLFCLCES